MNVSYWSRKSRNEIFHYEELDQLLHTSDVLVYALAKNEETKNILSDKIIKDLNPKALFVSTAHLNHELFISLVREGKLG
jgi:phosphoglycerate dehydrogenase-like enzyme